MDESARIGLITGVASIAGGFLSQFIGIYFQGRLNSLERARMIESRSAQLYLREIEAYDALVPGMAGVFYVARELTRDPILREPHQSSEEALNAYQRIQEQVREAVSNHMMATASHFHVIGPEAVDRIDATMRFLFQVIDEMTGPASGEPPVSEERANELYDELEDIRMKVLDHVWNSLDVQHLESSYQKIREAGERKPPTRTPRIMNQRIES